jgi:tripartite-type tricarboxylate transporter receptor subunit TctC
MFKDTPTFTELGKDMVYFMQRTVVGAPGMSADAEAYYVDLFTRVFNSDEWQTYRKKKSLQGDLLTGQKLMDYWKHEREIHKNMLIKMGAISG